MNKENCALKLVDEIILYYDARSKKHQIKIIISPQTVNPVDSKCSVTIETDTVFAYSVMLRFALEIIRNSFTLAVG